MRSPMRSPSPPVPGGSGAYYGGSSYSYTQPIIVAPPVYSDRAGANYGGSSYSYTQPTIMAPPVYSDRTGATYGGSSYSYTQPIIVAPPVYSDKAGDNYGGSSYSYSQPIIVAPPVDSDRAGAYYGGSSYSNTQPTIVAPPVDSNSAGVVGSQGVTSGGGSSMSSSPSSGGGGGAYDGVSRYSYTQPVIVAPPVVSGSVSELPTLLVLLGLGLVFWPEYRLGWSDNAREALDKACFFVRRVLGPGMSVVLVSVALDVPNRDHSNSILSVLSRLSTTASTDSRVGIQNLTSEVALELLRRKASVVSALTRSKYFRDPLAGERDFNQLSVKERSKFEQETVNKFRGVDYSTGVKSSKGADVDGKATMAVVTIVMALEGDSTKVSQIDSMNDLEEALRRIAADAKDCLECVEILWTPEDRSETLSMSDVLADYPGLRTI
jgi:uncharacterized membrane protein